MRLSYFNHINCNYAAINFSVIALIRFALTSLGFEFAQTALSFKLWAEGNVQHVIRAQKQFDAIQAKNEPALLQEA